LEIEKILIVELRKHSPMLFCQGFLLLNRAREFQNMELEYQELLQISSLFGQCHQDLELNNKLTLKLMSIW
jgi:hypothetical protein